MKTALYGGSFNPPHLGHRAVVEAVLKKLKPDRFIIMPDNLPPHKEMPESAPSALQRLEMCEIAFSELESIRISDLEISRGGKSYTSDTLEALKRLYPGDDFYLVIGSDMLLSFTTWHRFRDILANCVLVVLSREKNDLFLLERERDALTRDYRAEIEILRVPPVVVSSNRIREKLESGSVPDGLSPGVYSYIKQNRLYGT